MPSTPVRVHVYLRSCLQNRGTQRVEEGALAANGGVIAQTRGSQFTHRGTSVPARFDIDWAGPHPSGPAQCRTCGYRMSNLEIPVSPQSGTEFSFKIGDLSLLACFTSLLGAGFSTPLC